MVSKLDFVTLDVFTGTPYTGNPLAVVRVPSSVTLTQEQKQQIAREFNLSETVILHEQTDEDRAEGLVRINIFTAYYEITFAGHPTVGTANYLLRLLPDVAAEYQGVEALQLKAGRFPIQLHDAVDGIQTSVAHNVHIHNNPFAGRPYGHYPVVSIVKGMTFILARLSGGLEELAAVDDHLLGVNKVFRGQAELDDGWRVGNVGSYYYVDLGYEDKGSVKVRKIRARMFSSREDPATGSAASALCSWLSLQEPGAETYRYHVTQGVEMGQKSDIHLEVRTRVADGGDSRTEIEEVRLSGSAVLTMEGKLAIPQA
ncbi:phenazine biosynthesis protein-like protein phzf family [Dactylonectria estremocensis]|uniref:Phenazine biosynthesis protein-like protein phzf family n=1 Tax=Dactylonectria estremocensis TaxID=1079267 RepID=A0A9P9D565_9HYPO|nr:phenazine biosynthesis protein-like protein phzf family [Dactylonectria estremocensis]